METRGKVHVGALRPRATVTFVLPSWHPGVTKWALLSMADNQTNKPEKIFLCETKCAVNSSSKSSIIVNE
jgi:hypothetical protein